MQPKARAHGAQVSKEVQVILQSPSQANEEEEEEEEHRPNPPKVLSIID